MSIPTLTYTKTDDRKPNILLGLAATTIAAISITNCIVYANGTTSSNSNNGSSGNSGSGDENLGVNTNCALLLLILNIIIAIIAIILMIYFFYRAIFNRQNRDYFEAQVNAARKNAINFDPSVVYKANPYESYAVPPTNTATNPPTITYVDVPSLPQTVTFS
jgi:hypothetical protein